ncbi:DUF2189 domain-containing protein [Rubrivivax rivuli]|uniref:DUF2189 domain-containing protein n=1 Tax=Rubrivivax rivuli TaxID=1862385 RepID=A0A437RK07_9BURK|nr:DUF2189 domain-containing protein [Rubrivivax rivuli]RVU47113.1 DUF2189 domain-containing protein [Rubrivivax rivuli]
MSQPERRTAALRVRPVPATRPLQWLALGWADLWRCPLPGLLHGALAAAFGALLLTLARDRFWALAGSFSGFLLVAPVVATGLYAVSRALEQGQRPTLRTALAAWRPRDHRLVVFGLLLALAGTGWVLTSASLITRFAPAPVGSPADFLRVVVLSDHSLLFEIWLMLGSALAAPMFISSVVALPLLLDRPHSVLQAVMTSASAALASPPAMALWATLILVLTLVGMASFMVGLVVVVPWLAHASWHAYRDLVPPDEAAGAPA